MDENISGVDILFIVLSRIRKPVKNDKLGKYPQLATDTSRIKIRKD